MKHYKIIYDGITYEFDAEEVGAADGRPLAARGSQAVRTVLEKQPAACRGKTVMAPVAGRVLEVSVAAGSSFAEGDTLVLLDAMKMEIPVQAEEDGTVMAIEVKKGDQVDMEQVMITYQ